MHPILRNLLALIAGLVVCLMVNGLLIRISGSVIPPPAGVDVNDMKSIAAHMDEFRPKHLLFPFLAHALGSLIGAFVAAVLAATRKMTWAWVVGSFHLLGGIMAAVLIPAPIWFIVLDLVVAYLPMAWLGGRFAKRRAMP
ncbi:MAG: hypothetical protein ABI599_11830 [Flavobacteriales bacterium]